MQLTHWNANSFWLHMVDLIKPPALLASIKMLLFVRNLHSNIHSRIPHYLACTKGTLSKTIYKELGIQLMLYRHIMLLGQPGDIQGVINLVSNTWLNCWCMWYYQYYCLLIITSPTMSKCDGRIEEISTLQSVSCENWSVLAFNDS